MNRHTQRWFETAPKAELHLHLEGAIPLEALHKLLNKYGGDESVPDRAALERRFTFRDFPHFIETWVWKNGFLREYDDFTLIAEAAARELATQNIVYAEVYFSPSDFFRHGLGTGRLAEAIRTGLDAVPEIEIALIADLVRDRGPENAAVTLAEAHEAREYGIIGIGLGGSEQEYPLAPFAPVYEEARRLGFRTTAHAGEAEGPDAIWSAVHDLRVDRIGHGTRAAEDEALMDHLAEARLPIEICPLSNVRTGVVPSVAAHPARLFHEKGMVLTINTDDPAMFGNSLAAEYALLESELGFDRAGIRDLILEGARSSWLPEERRSVLVRRIESGTNF